MRTCKVKVSGRVQGVGYRAWVVSQARALSLTGQVRNLPDGSVEAVLQGPEEQVLQLLESMQEGPSYSRVTGFFVNELPEGKIFSSFEVSY